MEERRLPTWTGTVIGLLVGALIGSLLLLGRERASRDDWWNDMAAREAYLDSLAATVVVGDTTATEAGRPAAAGGEDAVVSASRRNAIVRATEQAAPAVVSITVTHRQAVRHPHAAFWERYFPNLAPRREFVRETQSYGSGVIVSADGYVVTNEHVIDQPIEVLVTLSDGREMQAEVVEVVDRFDLALLKIPGEDLPVARLAESDDLHIGEWAIAIGSPFGYLLADTQPTVTVGVISALNRDIVRQTEGDRTYLGMIQTDAAINPGNSGGPLVNAAGEVIGINTFIFTESGGSIGIGFAVPVERVRWVLEEVREFGHYREVNWGFVLQKLSPSMVRFYGLQDPVGFIVTQVQPDSPTWKAGIRAGDIMRTLDGTRLDSRDTVLRLIFEAMVGDRVTFTAEREGEPFSGVIELEEVQK